ncbi:MAG TPA: tRNA dihydrouridine synthase DusB [Devosia sp.]|nr:tRNA dihydrouridine synthase DusB [Devosia sp.]
MNNPTLQIGNIELPGIALLAPMAGITDAPFRAIAEAFGAAMVVSEMIASANLVARPSKSQHRELVRKLEHKGKLPHVVQIAGNEEKWLVLGARIAADAGADIIDINMGCPSKKVTNGYAGSALMRVPDRALRLIETVVEASPVPVSVKMRLGWNDESLNAAHIARLAEGAGVQMVAVHGRTRQQFYKGEARWEPVREVVEAVDVPVIVNGDIVDHSSALKALAASRAAGVMIGRGAQGQPWIVGQVNASLKGEQPVPAPVGPGLIALVLNHYEEMLFAYGEKQGVRVARKHLRWYFEAAGLELPGETLRALLTEPDPVRVKTLVKGVLDHHGARVAA